MKGKKILVIVIIIVAVLAVAGTVFGYLFLKTDLLKSNKELFAKYVNQSKGEEFITSDELIKILSEVI